TELLVDLLREGTPAAAGAAVVELEDDEAAIRQVLPEELGRPDVVDELRLGPSVDHHDRGMSPLDRPWPEERAVQGVAARRRDGDVLHWAEAERGDVGIGRDRKLSGASAVAE